MTALILSATMLLGGFHTLQSTAYTPCSSGSTMADGTHTRTGSVAVIHGTYRMHTRLWVEPKVFGRHRYTVRDYIGSGSQLDIWVKDCSAGIRYGRRAVSVRVGWRRHVKHARSTVYRLRRRKLTVR